MSAHVLLNLLNKLGKMIKCEACRVNKSIKWSTNVRFYLSHDIKINYKSHFWRENVNILPSFAQF